MFFTFNLFRAAIFATPDLEWACPINWWLVGEQSRIQVCQPVLIVARKLCCKGNGRIPVQVICTESSQQRMIFLRERLVLSESAACPKMKSVQVLNMLKFQDF
jgi:hypothetical protein